jgi:hypothetical protein
MAISVSPVSGVSSGTATSPVVSSGSDNSKRIEQLRTQKNTDETNLTKLKQDTKTDNKTTIKNLQKEIDTLEKEIEDLQTQSSTNTANTNSTANTAKAASAEQEKESLQRFGPAYTTTITNQGQTALQNELETKKETL